MLTLGIDTSQKTGSIAVVENGNILSVLETEHGISCSKSLWSTTEKCIAESNKQISDISIIGIVVGPGSFTGLRIGISFVMGLCYGNNIKAVPLSSLEVLAYGHDVKDAKIRPIIDARRNEVFTALFEKRDGIYRRLEDDRIESVESLGEYREEILCKPADWNHKAIQAVTVERTSTGSSAAMLAREYTQKATAAYKLKPVYLRLSAAEEKLKK